MALSSHLQQLQLKHQHLSKEVETAQRSPSCDALTLAELKKRKLRLKEQIHRLSH